MLSPYHLLVNKTEKIFSFAERIKLKMQQAENDLVRQIKRLLTEGSELSHYHPQALKYLEHASELCCYLHPRLEGKEKMQLENLYKHVEYERWQRVYFKSERDQKDPALKKEAMMHLNELANAGHKPSQNFFKQQRFDTAVKIAMRKAPNDEYTSFAEINNTVNEFIKAPGRGA